MAPVQRYAEHAEHMRRLARTFWAIRVQVHRVHDRGKAKYAANALVGPLSCFMALKPCRA
jgi:hypothetical protein